MQSLYKNGFEHIYDAMYQTFIDYHKEFLFYNSIKKTYNKNTVLELGCGSGNLAKHFIEADSNYIGLDLSEDMVALSSTKNPKGRFIQGDITNFKLDEKVDLTLITGRTSSYLFTNTDVSNALKAIANNLAKNGILCFDFIDASRFLKEIKGGKEIVHFANFNDKQYFRQSFMKETTQNNFMFQWDALYYEKTSDTNKLITKDSSIVRAFTKEEWDLLLYLNGFKLIEFIDRKSYAFDTYVVVAEKL